MNQHLETRFAKAVAGRVMYEPDKSSIAKPSELVTSVRAYMNVLQTVENHIHIDMTRIFNSVLLQQVNKAFSGIIFEHLIICSKKKMLTFSRAHSHALTNAMRRLEYFRGLSRLLSVPGDLCVIF